MRILTLLLTIGFGLACVQGQDVTPCMCDFNNDGIVGTGDVTVMLGQFGASGNADLDCDGIVGTLDMLPLLANLGANCCQTHDYDGNDTINQADSDFFGSLLCGWTDLDGDGSFTDDLVDVTVAVNINSGITCPPATRLSGDLQQLQTALYAWASSGKTSPLTIAPNPVQNEGWIVWDFPIQEGLQIEVYNMDGRLALSTNETSLSTSQLPTGTYKVVARIEGVTFSETLIRR